MIKNKLSVIVLLMSLISGVSLATDQELNLLKSDYFRFKSIPVYDQGSFGNCYAYSAIQLVDYHRLVKNEKISKFNDLTSVLWGGFLYKEKSLVGQLLNLTGFGHDPTKPFDGGDSFRVLTGIRKHGICTRGQMNEVVRARYGDILSMAPNISAGELRFILEKMLENYDSLYKKSYNLHLSKLPTSTFDSKFRFPSYSSDLSKRPPIIEPVEVVRTPSTPITSNVSERSNTRVAVSPKLPEIKLELDLDYNIASVDNTRVHIPVAIDFSEVVRPTNEVTVPAIDNKPDYYVAPVDNTRVVPVFDDYAIQFSKAYARKTLFEALKKKYGFNKEVLGLILDKITTPNGLENTFNDIMDDCRKDSIDPPQFTAHQYLSLSKKDFVSKISERLKKNSPLIIDYCSSILSSGKVTSFFKIKDSDCNHHVSIVVGLRSIKNKIQVLIQNSWGPSCSGYHSAWTCLENQGAIWVDLDVLFSSSSYRLLWIN